MKPVVLCVQNLWMAQNPRVWWEARTLGGAGGRICVLSPFGTQLPEAA
jgi:hypothetical protein